VVTQIELRSSPLARDRRTNVRLVAIDRRRVHVPVSDGECRLDSALRVSPGRDPEDAKSELRNRTAVTKADCRLLSHAAPSSRRGLCSPATGERRDSGAGYVVEVSTPAIETVGLTKHYADTRALDELDLQVQQGEVFGYLGPNGAGKTTTIRLLLGLHRPTAGRAELFGIDAWHDPVAAHRRLAYVASEPYLWPGLTGTETLEFLGRLRDGKDRAYRSVLIERFQLEADKKVRALSHGNRQKVQLIAAFASRADLLILDEPTGGLDPLMEMAFRETVLEAKNRGQTLFLSSHILSEVEAVCDRVGILRQGRLVDQGTLAELRHLGALTVEVVFEGEAPTLPPMPGVAVASAGANALRFEVSGEVGPLIAALADYPVKALTSREPSLEEIFLHHYEGTDGRVGR
jgi:polyether ionophore transport system ATP-binding protein